MTGSAETDAGLAAGCGVCGGACDGADLAPLLTPELAWLWFEVAKAADRRGDPHLRTGSLTIRLPEDAAERAPATGLLGGRALPATGSRRVDLAKMTARLQARRPNLTPGAVAAHSVGRPLAPRTRVHADRLAREAELEDAVHGLLECGPLVAAGVGRAELWAAIRRSGWVTRLVKATDGRLLVGQATAVLRSLPIGDLRADRRRLADGATGNPHALDEGSPLAGLVLAVLTAAGLLGVAMRARAAWDAVGVDFDDLTGGLITLGVHPRGWTVPAGATVTLPPRELADVVWARPPFADAWVFVTENPSVGTAAADLVAREGVTVALVCTSGTPSALEVRAIGRLPSAGWRVAVRADFDEAGLAHVRSLLAGVPGAVAWRMGASDYRASLRADTAEARQSVTMGATPWDPDLAPAMAAAGVPAFEESLLDVLLGDLGRGIPPMTPLHCESPTQSASDDGDPETAARAAPSASSR